MLSEPMQFSHLGTAGQAVVINPWDSIPPHILLQGNTNGWRTVLQDMQRYIVSLYSMYCIIVTARFTKM